MFTPVHWEKKMLLNSLHLENVQIITKKHIDLNIKFWSRKSEIVFLATLEAFLYDEL